ncbi:hypothetical protein [Vibrio sp. ABG19]|uniref:hypothetical protein n=1 Tax=Vibrio sp. ABG19 TaxID=2817385 RepID=UPI00249E88F7|nr:hypothetical protein [Vibrio sp. ABG19]WGY45251.1 hypothetical protein J0X00_06040 [Vibrio sp. ABG19]
MTAEQDQASNMPLPKKNTLLITRKEIIEIIGRSAGFVDKFIKNSDDFPQKVSHGCYKRKEVYDWLEKNNFM